MSHFLPAGWTARQVRTWCLLNLPIDVLFSLRSSSGQSVWLPGHKLVLASRSPVFERMLYRSPVFPQTGIINWALPDNSVEFANFFQYIYTDQMDPEHFVGILKCAMKYKVELDPGDVAGGINSRNLLTLFAAARRTKATTYLSILDAKIAENGPSVLNPNSIEFLVLDKESLLHILRLERIEIRAEDLLNAVDAWATFKCSRARQLLCSEAKRAQLGEPLESLPSVQAAFRGIPAGEFWAFYANESYSSFITQRQMFQLTFTKPLPQSGLHSSASEPEHLALPPLQFKIKIFYGRDSYLFLLFSPFSPIMDVKAAVCMMTRVPPEKQQLRFRLSFGETLLLEDRHTIAHYGIQDGSVIRLDCVV